MRHVAFEALVEQAEECDEDATPDDLEIKVEEYPEDADEERGAFIRA